MANSQTIAMLLSAATASTNGPDMENIGGRGVQLVINITTLTGTVPTATFTIQGKDSSATPQYYNILASTALAATGVTVLKVYPGLTAAANTVANDVLPATWRVILTAGGTVTNLTATVTANIIN